MTVTIMPNNKPEGQGYRYEYGELIPHAEHNYEMWAAYVAPLVPEGILPSADGICCHDCRTVVVDPFFAPSGDIRNTINQ